MICRGVDCKARVELSNKVDLLPNTVFNLDRFKEDLAGLISPLWYLFIGTYWGGHRSMDSMVARGGEEQKP